MLEIDHILPVNKGGTDDLGNLRTLCRSDHIDRHRPKLTPAQAEWRAYLKRFSPV